MNDVKSAIAAFATTQELYSRFGAWDSEPDRVFHEILVAAIHGKDYEVPETGEGWDLYTLSMNCEPAAKAMRNACKNVIKAIEQCPDEERDAMTAYVQKYCWRVTD